MGASSHLLINEPPLQALPTLAKAIGLDAAVILQQIHYWLQASSHVKDNKPWIFNSYKDWAEQFPWLSPHGVQRQILKLEKSGILVSRQFSKAEGDARKWYTIDYGVLGGVVPKPHHPMPKPRGGSAKTAQSTSYKTTQENTTEKGNDKPSARRKAAAARDSQIEKIFADMRYFLGWRAEGDIDPIPNYGKEGKAIKRMLTRGFEPADILKLWKKKVQGRGGFVSMTWVNEDIGAPPHRQPGLLPTGDELEKELTEKGLDVGGT